MASFIHIYEAVSGHSKCIWPSQGRFPKVWASSWRINRSYSKKWMKRCSRQRDKYVQRLWRKEASRMPWCWFWLSSWEHVGIVLPCVLEGRSRVLLLPMGCEHTGVCHSWVEASRAICNLPCFLLPVSAPRPPVIADAYWTHSTEQ